MYLHIGACGPMSTCFAIEMRGDHVQLISAAQSVSTFQGNLTLDLNLSMGVEDLG